MTLSDFFHMGGYAVYVWPSYGLALVVLVANLYFARREEQNLINDIFAAGQTDES